MKTRIDAILHREQALYLEGLHPASEGLIAEMEQYAAANRVPIADREVALFLEITAQSIGARKVLEIGMAIGYAVLHLLRGMGGEGQVVTIEPSEEMIALAGGYFQRAGMSERVRVERGYALEVIPKLEDKFDLIYLDAIKEEYEDYLELSLPLLRTGGIVIADNLLWGGQVAGEISAPDQQKSTEGLRRFNQRFVNHKNLRSVVLPVGDGLGYGIKLG
ncbi:MAG TPA: O-methyltransferase [Pyrinomonadaceae bacterium]|jgi:predicted O-methyltransferase YrrM|nr:O-methyltransferase [Pyrinomonadaceae bacterium]